MPKRMNILEKERWENQHIFDDVLIQGIEDLCSVQRRINNLFMVINFLILLVLAMLLFWK
jgi:hypothetical protein